MFFLSLSCSFCLVEAFQLVVVLFVVFFKLCQALNHPGFFPVLTHLSSHSDLSFQILTHTHTHTHNHPWQSQLITGKCPLQPFLNTELINEMEVEGQEVSLLAGGETPLPLCVSPSHTRTHTPFIFIFTHAKAIIGHLQLYYRNTGVSVL